MGKLRNMCIMIMAASVLLMACKTVETRSEAPVAPVIKNVKLMVPDAN